MPWPQGAVVQGFITEVDKPDAVKDMLGAVVRLPIFEGEPIRPEKIADSNSRITLGAVCRPASAPSQRKSRSQPAPAGSSFRTTASTSSWSAGRREATSS